MAKTFLGSLSICALACGAFIAAAGANAPLGWEEAFHAARNRSETYQEQQELVYQAQEKYKQAVGSVLPNITGSWQYLQQHFSPGSALFVDPIEKTGKITATQPIFEGFRDWAALKQTKLNEKAQAQTKKQVLVQLYQQVTGNFYQVISAERTIYNLQSESKLYDKQIAQLKTWVKIGRSRAADVTQVQAALAQVYASVEQYKNQLDTAREAFAFLTGLPRDTPLEDPYPYNFEPSLERLDQYLGAVERRPEVMSAAYSRDAADEGISIAKGQNLPSVSIYGDYYFQNVGNFISPTWDFVLGVSLPIFAGGTIESQVRQAASQFHQAELAVTQDQRLADQEIRTYFDRVRDDSSQVRSLQNAKDISWVNYQQEVHDYRLGLVTNLDVLQSLTTFVTTVLSLDQTKYQEKIDYLYFEAATGQAKDVAF